MSDAARSMERELVWHRANSVADLESFFASSVRWVECDARADPEGTVRVSHEPIGDPGEGLELRRWLAAVHDAGRAAKIDLKEDGLVLDRMLEEVARLGWRDEDLWFNAAVEIPGRYGFERLATVHPGARRSLPLDTLAAYLREEPASFAVLDALEAWSLDWVCFGAKVPGLPELVSEVRRRGWGVNIWDVSTPTDFHAALALGPDAITADPDAIPSTLGGRGAAPAAMDGDRTRVSGVVFLRDGPTPSVLLVRQDYGGRLWIIPGGTDDPRESPLDAAIREVREELGTDARIDKLVGTYDISGAAARTEYIFRGSIRDDGEPAIHDGELDGIGWFPLDHLPTPHASWLEVILDDAIMGRSNIVRSFVESSEASGAEGRFG